MPKRTYQPNKRRAKKKHGFRNRMETKNGRNVFKTSPPKGSQEIKQIVSGGAFMLNKNNRISRNKDFDRVFKLGRSFYGKIIGLKAVDNNASFTRLGILISTKVSKKAVVRNRFKRQIRRIIQEQLANIKEGKDIIIIVFPEILDKKFQEIKDFLKIGLNRLNLYK